MNNPEQERIDALLASEQEMQKKAAWWISEAVWLPCPACSSAF